MRRNEWRGGEGDRRKEREGNKGRKMDNGAEKGEQEGVAMVEGGMENEVQRMDEGVERMEWGGLKKK